MERSEQCNISFRLDYILGNGELRNLGIWQERYDGQVSVIDIDLNFLARSDVVFILSTHVENNYPNQADGFWFAPRVESVESNVAFEKPGEANRSKETN
jgi:hypothetical protein